MKRPLTQDERNVISQFANKIGIEQGAQLLADLADAEAETVTDDGSRIVFEIGGYQRPKYQGQHPFNVEGKMLDRDGSELTVLLHVDENNRLLELEIIRWSSGNLIAPDWSTLNL